MEILSKLRAWARKVKLDGVILWFAVSASWRTVVYKSISYFRCRLCPKPHRSNPGFRPGIRLFGQCNFVARFDLSSHQDDACTSAYRLLSTSRRVDENRGH